MFWDKFYELCTQNNTKPNPVAKELGYSTAVCTRWRNGTLPNTEALVKISCYFNVSIDSLLENEITVEKKRQAEEKQKKEEQKASPVFDFEFASEPPPNQPEPIIEMINDKKRIKNYERTDTIWVQSAAYEGIFPSFNKKAAFIKYTVEELEELLNEEDVID